MESQKEGDARRAGGRGDGLEKSYGALRVLDGIDLAVARGSVLALLGPNGAGKTTTVRILATLLRAGRRHRPGRRLRRRRASAAGSAAASASPASTPPSTTCRPAPRTCA